MTAEQKEKITACMDRMLLEFIAVLKGGDTEGKHMQEFLIAKKEAHIEIGSIPCTLPMAECANCFKC